MPFSGLGRHIQNETKPWGDLSALAPASRRMLCSYTCLTQPPHNFVLFPFPLYLYLSPRFLMLPSFITIPTHKQTPYLDMSASGNHERVLQELEEPKEKKTIWARSGVSFFAQVLLLAAITTACALCFIYSVRDLSAVNDRIYDFNSLKIAADIFLKLGYQPVVFGTPAAGSNPELASQLEKFGKRKRVTLDMSMVNLWLSLVFTYGVNPDPSFQNFGLDAVELIGLHVTEQVQALTVKQVDQTYTAQTGLICVSEQVNQLFSHNSLLLPQIIKEWGQTQIQLFYGSAYDQMIFPDCTGYLSAAKDFSFEPVILNGPTISSGAKLTQKYQKSPLTSPVIVAALDALASTIAATEKSAEEYWQSQKQQSLLSTVFSLISTCLMGTILLLMPFFYTRGNMEVDNGLLARYGTVESAIKILTVHAVNLTALTEDPKLLHFLEGTFLVKFIGFIRRARPFIQQTAFGDIENVVLSSADNGLSGNFVVESGSSGNRAAAHGGDGVSNEDDQRAQELRSETGLQVTQGTVLCLSRSGIIHEEGERHQCGLDAWIRTMNQVVGVFESASNARHGAVHSITDRFVFMTWNVTSSCPEHELEALTAALEIANALRNVVQGVSMTVASSLLLAGTVEAADDRTVMICGPAMLTCEKMQALNRYHGTTIVMDKSVASKAFLLNIPGCDYCSVPLSLYRPDGRSTTPQVAYGLFPCRLTEPLKAWITQFKEFPMLMEAHRIQEMLDIVEEYKRTYAGSVIAGRDGSTVTMDRTVNFWTTAVKYWITALQAVLRAESESFCFSLCFVCSLSGFLETTMVDAYLLKFKLLFSYVGKGVIMKSTWGRGICFDSSYVWAVSDTTPSDAGPAIWGLGRLLCGLTHRTSCYGRERENERRKEEEQQNGSYAAVKQDIPIDRRNEGNHPLQSIVPLRKKSLYMLKCSAKLASTRKHLHTENTNTSIKSDKTEHIYRSQLSRVPQKHGNGPRPSFRKNVCSVDHIYLICYRQERILSSVVTSTLAFRWKKKSMGLLPGNGTAPREGSLVNNSTELVADGRPVDQPKTYGIKSAQKIPFIVQIVVLLSLTASSAVCLGYNVKNLAKTNDMRYNFATVKLLGEVIQTLSSQSVVFGSPAAGPSQHLIEKVDEIGRRKRISLNMEEVKENLDMMFKYGPQSDFNDQMKALQYVEVLGLMLMKEVDLQTSRQVGKGNEAQVGLQCVSKQVHQLFVHYMLLLPSVFKLWTKTEYQLYEGLDYNKFSYPDCVGYLPQLKEINFMSIIENGPHPTTDQKLTVQYTKSPLSAATVQDSLSQLAVEVERVQSQLDDYWKKKLKNSTLIVICMSTAMILSAAFALLTPIFYTEGFVYDDKLGLALFRHVESRIKRMRPYSSSVTSLKEEPQLKETLQGTFLIKLIGFIRRARPFIQQTAFGDVENVVLSTLDATSGQFTMEQGGNTSTGGDNRSAVEEEDQRGRDLRLETGLQVAYGTVMILARRTAYYTSVHTAGGDESFVTNAQKIEDRRFVMNMGVGMLEKVVNARHGAIHTITDRCVVMSWNVTSSCPEHELNALSAGVEIMNALYAVPGGITISIASSLLLAGTVEEGDERTVMICGPAMLTCEKILGLNYYHHTLIAMDKNVASKVFSLSIPGQDYCAVPISLYRPDGRSTTPQVAYGLFPCRLTEPLKAWTSLFKTFPALVDVNHLSQVRKLILNYMETYERGMGRGGSAMSPAIHLDPQGLDGDPLSSLTQDGVGMDGQKSGEPKVTSAPLVSLRATVEFWLAALRTMSMAEEVSGSI
eukprot:gene3916-2784_t